MKNRLRTEHRGPRTTIGLLYTLVLLWLAGAGLRITVLAIPPIIPLLHHDLQLSQTDVGVLTGLPSLLFAAVAIPGAALIARFGVLRMLTCGLLLAAIAGALRSASPNVWILFATTFCMGAGIAVMQPAMAPVVRKWLPHHIGFATALYANGMLLGETLSASLTLPVVLPMLDHSWRFSLVFWSLPVFLAAFLIALRARGEAPLATRPGAASLQRWWPDWKDPLTWQVGLIMGCASAVFFGANGFLPDFLARSGRSDLIGYGLTLLNVSQVVATVILLFVAKYLTLKRLPFIATGVIALVSLGGLILMPGAWVLLWCALIGFCCAFTLTMGMSVPALVAAPDDAHRLAAALFTISYFCAFLIPTLGGIGWDLSGLAAMAFIPAVGCAALIIFLGIKLDFARYVPVSPA